MENNFTNLALSIADRYKGFRIQRKKHKALTNYSSCAPFGYADYLKILGKILKDSLPTGEEMAFLDYLLTKAGIVYLDWAHKTRWLKKEMSRVRRKHNITVSKQLGLFVDYDKKAKVSTAMPTHLLPSTKSSLSKHMRGGR